jgi:hypothetical protein
MHTFQNPLSIKEVTNFPPKMEHIRGFPGYLSQLFLPTGKYVCNVQHTLKCSSERLVMMLHKLFV